MTQESLSEAEYDAITDAAAHWCMRLHAVDCSAEERLAFEQWRDAHPLHAFEYEAMLEIWDVAEHLPRPSLPPTLNVPMTTAVPIRQTLGEVLRRSNPQMHTARPGRKTVAAELDFNHLVNEKKATGTMANIASAIDKADAWAAGSDGVVAMRWIRYPQAAIRRSHLLPEKSRCRTASAVWSHRSSTG